MRNLNKLYFVILLSLCGCRSINQKDSKSVISSYSSNFPNIYGLNLIDWDDVLTQDQKIYYSYIFSWTCSYCNKLRNQINTFANICNYPFYFIEFSNDIPVKDNAYAVIGCKNIENLYISGTPTLFLIKDNVIAECYLGFEKINNYVLSPPI